MFERGSTLVIPVEFKKQAPFGTADYFAPSPAPTITVTDPAGTKKVDAADMTKSTTGKWYYIAQTAVDWVAGVYEIKIASGDGVYTDIEIKTGAFALE